MKNTKNIRVIGAKAFSAICITLALTVSSQVTAAVVYTADSRYVNSVGGDGNGGSWNNTYYPATPFSDWSRGGQTSSLGANGFSASGSGYAFSDLGWSEDSSFFDISFTLTTATDMQMTGNLYGEEINFGIGRASIQLLDSTNNVLYSNSVSSSFGIEQSAIFFSSMLSAGDYRLIAQADPYTQEASSSYSLQASLTAVPLPAAGPLFLFGLSGLLLARKRRNAA